MWVREDYPALSAFVILSFQFYVLYNCCKDVVLLSAFSRLEKTFATSLDSTLLFVLPGQGSSDLYLWNMELSWWNCCLNERKLGLWVFQGRKGVEKSCFPWVTYIGLLQVLAEVLICKQWTEVDLRIKENWNKCSTESIVAGGCQLRLGTNPLWFAVPWLPPSGKNKDCAGRQGWWMAPGSACNRSSYVI